MKNVFRILKCLFFGATALLVMTFFPRTLVSRACEFFFGHFDDVPISRQGHEVQDSSVQKKPALGTTMGFANLSNVSHFKWLLKKHIQYFIRLNTDARRDLTCGWYWEFRTDDFLVREYWNERLKDDEREEVMSWLENGDGYALIWGKEMDTGRVGIDAIREFLYPYKDIVKGRSPPLLF